MRKGWLISAAVLMAAAAFFKFALLGYSVTAMILLSAAVLCAVMYLLERLGRKHPKAARRIRAAIAAALAAGLVLFAVLETAVIKAARTDEQPGAEYLIVLGAGVNGSTPSLSLVERLRAAKAYMEEYPDAIAVVSGGQGPGEDITEAEAMKIWLTENGIAPERIVKEERASSTMENLEFSRELIAERGEDVTAPVAIVTSEYHLYRAGYMARKMGMDSRSVAARTSLPILRVNYFVREAFAVAYLKVFG